jgi:putative iron-regulated protein
MRDLALDFKFLTLNPKKMYTRNTATLSRLFFLAFCLYLFQACNHPDIVQPTAPLDAQKTQVLLGFANMTSVLTGQISGRAEVLRDSALIFIANPTDDLLVAVQKSWIHARQPWEMQEAFEVGPVETLGIDPAVDTWPVDTQGVDSAIPNVPGFLASAPLAIKGYHGIEYLLWGADGTKQAADFTSRQLILLDSLTRDLVTQTNVLNSQWGPSGAFYQNFTNAGTAKSNYINQDAALTDALDAIAGLIQEMTADKLGFPLQDPVANHGESQYSDNSRNDYLNDLLSIKAAYTGGLPINQQQYISFTNLVRPKNSALDDAIIKQIDNIQIDLLSMPASFNYVALHDTAQLRRTVNGFLQLSPQFTSGVSNLLFGKTAVIIDTD